MKRASVVVVGGGHAAAQLCGSLAEAGRAPGVVLVCGEDSVPYQRPPLSKAFLQADAQTLQQHRDPGWYEQHGIRVVLGQRAVAIDRARREVELAGGERVAYEQLVLATGARARVFAPFDRPLRNVHALRSAADAAALRELLLADSRGRLSVLGGGFIGLEVAATARKLGWQVQVFEAAPRLLARAVSPELARHVLEQHREQGIEVQLDFRIDGVELQGDCVRALRSGERQHAVEHLLLGVGAVPETGLAQRAGLAVDNGIVVDASLRTCDPAILAIGDCAAFPLGGAPMRLESVQNANDQAKVAAAVLGGEAAAYLPLPWFWSDQGGLRLQMAGLWHAGLQAYRRQGAAPSSFSLFHYDGTSLRCVESANAPLDHLMARKLLAQGISPAPGEVSDPGTALKTLL